MNASLDAARHLVEQVTTLAKVTDALREYEEQHPKLYDDEGNVLRCFAGWLSDRGINLLGDEQAAPQRKSEPAAPRTYIVWFDDDVVQAKATGNVYSRLTDRDGDSRWVGREPLAYVDSEIDSLVERGLFRVLRQKSAEEER